MTRNKITAALTAILCAASTFAAFPAMNAQAVQTVYNDFEQTYNGWHGSTDEVGFEAEDGAGYQGSRGMRVFGRQSSADGAASSKGLYLVGGVSYTYSVKVQADTAETFHLSVLTLDEKTDAQTIKEIAVKKADAGKWVTLTGKYTAPRDSYEFELKITTDSTADFRMDNAEITTRTDTTAITAAAAETGLKDEFGGYFRIGNILNGGTVRNSSVTALILKDCTAVECENETKPDATLVRNGSTDNNIKISLNSCAAIMDFCVQNNLGFRGHTLVWHSQMPQWFFKQGFNENGAWVDKNTMNTRMESEIKNTFNAIQTQYPTLDLYAYDVCNECVSDDGNRTKNNGGARMPGWGNGASPWVQIYGSNAFVEQAFTYARQYAPATCKLYYNDYNEYWDHKRDCIYNMCKSLYEKGVLDGVGMQSHIGAEWEGFTGVSTYVGAMKKYLSIGCDVQITELDISVDGGKYSFDDQAKKYAAIFQAAVDWNRDPQSTGKVTLIQIWGPDDGHTWLKSGSDALLYDRSYKPKKAYNALMSLLPQNEWRPAGDVEPVTDPEPDTRGYWLNVDFDENKGSFSGRGSAKAEISQKEKFSGSNSLYVSGREAEWNGAGMNLNSRIFKAGESYSFSTNVMYTGGNDPDSFYLSLQYTGSDGEVHYDHIAEAAVNKGKWVQLTNTSYKMPEGGSGFHLYVEMPESTSDFYMDDVIVAKDQTVIQGAGKSDVKIPRKNSLQGDVNGDGVIDVYDLALAKRGIVKGFDNKYDEESADIDGNGKVEITDLVTLTKFLHKQITKLPEIIKPTEPPKPAFNYQSSVSYHEPNRPGENYLDPIAEAGKITKETYNGIRGTKQLNVYTPYGYDPSKKYNIFYLMHGGGEHLESVLVDSKVANILDHMIKNGEIEPMIVVCPTFNGSGSSAENFYQEFSASVVPFVEGKYSTYAKSTSVEDLRASRMHRAYGGFSMGGGSTWKVACNCMDIVGYFMPLSGHNWDGVAGLTKEIDKLGFTPRDYFIFACTGSDDIAHGNMVPQINAMKQDTKHFVYTSDFSKGNFFFLDAPGKVHWWGQVRWYVYDALPYFFHEGQ